MSTRASPIPAEMAEMRVLEIQRKLHRTYGERDAWQRARPVRRSGSGKCVAGNGVVAPPFDPTASGPVPESLLSYPGPLRSCRTETHSVVMICPTPFSRYVSNLRIWDNGAYEAAPKGARGTRGVSARLQLRARE